MEIPSDQWVQKYKPKPSPSGDYGYDFGDGSTLLEAYDYDHGTLIANAVVNEPSRLWTVVDDDEGNAVVVPGYHFVNRQGYIITQEPWENEDIFVNLED